MTVAGSTLRTALLVLTFLLTGRSPGGASGDGERDPRRGPHGRTSLLLVALAVVVACGREPAPGAPRTLDRLHERATPVACEPVEGVEEAEAVVEGLHAVSDSTLLALLPLERRVVLLGPDLSRLAAVPFEPDGPRGVRNPKSATLVDDSLVYVADLGPRRIRILDLAGEDRGTIRLSFPPDKVRSSPVGVLVAAFPLGMSRGSALLWRIEDGEGRPVGLPLEPHEDPRAEALANLIEITPLAAGEIVAAHQVVSSSAVLIRGRPDGGVDVTPTTVPIAESERDRLGRVPPDLFEAENVEAIAAPVLGASADGSTGDYLYLTRTGATLPGGGSEKAIVRARPDLSFVAAYRLDVNGQSFAYLAKGRTAIVIDDEARWHACVLP